MKRYLGFGLVAAFLLGAVFVVRPPEVASAGGLGGPGLTSTPTTRAAAYVVNSGGSYGLEGLPGGTQGLSSSGSAAVLRGATLYLQGTSGSPTFATLDSTGFSLTPLVGTAGSGTGITTNASAMLGHYVHKITVAETALTSAATTQDITIWTVPAKTRLLRIVVSDVTGFTGGGLTAMTVMCGPSGGSAVYLVAGSIFTTAAVLGDVAAEIGSSLTAATVADIPSMTTTQAIVCRFTSTTANVVAATAGTATFYIEAMTYP